MESQKTVLVVEDEPAVLKVVTAALKSFGYGLLSARSGKEGLNIFHEHRDKIDLVLTDVRMPLMSGPEMVDIMLNEKPVLKVMFMSAHHGETRLPVHPAKKFHFLEKPFPLAELRRAVRDCLENCH
jgi:two-component system cell cycle sensor histidine kinase/response regulator CckA